jgi:DNA-binding NarL/FixJ family response regulator
MQCQVHRGTGETVPPEIWFSTYKEASARKLAAIIAEISEEQPQNTSHSSQAGDAPRRLNLNGRQTAVLRLVLEGRRNAEIAARLEISSSAVKNTLQQLFMKAEVNSRSQLVRVALENYRDLL